MPVTSKNFRDAYKRAVALYQAGRLDEAEAECRIVLSAAPGNVDAKNLSGAIAMARGDFQRAIVLFSEAAALAPHVVAFAENQADALHAAERFTEALTAYDAALALDPSRAAASFKRGAVLQRLGRLEDAISGFTAALAIEPEHASALQARGAALAALGRHSEALADYDRAVALTPNDAKIHAARAEVLRLLQRRSDAFAAIKQALAIDPNLSGVRERYVNLGLGETTRGDELEQVCAELAAINARRDAESLRTTRTISDFRLLHDVEQTWFLIARDIAAPGLKDAHDALAEANERRGRRGEKSIALSDAEVNAIAAFREVPVRISAQELSGPALNPNKDWAAVEDDYFISDPEVVVIDQFLSPEALVAMREFALVSTIWNREYQQKYLGAFPETGFLGPLHLQIATEMRERMPRIFGPYRLRQAWGFKYSASLDGRGIGVHADFARVNINFWLTPDEANLDPESGGVLIYDKPAPEHWNFQKFNSDTAGIYAFLKRQGAEALTVRHRCNRAALFNSALFHETDTISFKEGYENRRINVTYLFA